LPLFWIIHCIWSIDVVHIVCFKHVCMLVSNICSRICNMNMSVLVCA
jgi:hypothetical protein